MKSSKKLFVLAALVASLGASACHTIAGAGQDVSKTGDAVTDTAHKTTPRSP